MKAIALKWKDPWFILKQVTYFIVGAILILLSACTGASVSEPMATESPLANPPQVVLDAQAWLVDQLETTIDETKLVQFEQTEWSDSCLGLGGPAESCAAVVTPGWKVIVEVAGEQYEVRTNEDGTVIKVVQG